MQGNRGRIAFVSPMKEEIVYTVKFIFGVINNNVERDILLVGLNLAVAIRIDFIVIKGDSQLVINKVNGQF